MLAKIIATVAFGIAIYAVAFIINLLRKKSPTGKEKTAESGADAQFGKEDEPAVIVRYKGGTRRQSVRDFGASVASGQVAAEAEVLSRFLFGDGRWRRVAETQAWRLAHGSQAGGSSAGDEQTSDVEVEKRARAASGQENVPEAKRGGDAERLLLEDPDVWLRKGLLLLEQRKWRDAATCLSRALAIAPHNPDALFGLAQAEDALGATDSSKGHFGQFLVYAPSDDSGRIAEAQRRLRKATN